MAQAGERAARPSKIPKVQQNHSVTITSIDVATMDHYCTISILPDKLHPDGTTKRGVKINMHEFSKGCQILGDRCGYRLLSPLSAFQYSKYLEKATEDFMKNGDGNAKNRPVIQARNQTPFKYKNRFFVCGSSSHVVKVFELFLKEDFLDGFATEVDAAHLPFVINWCGPDIKPMFTEDSVCLRALVRMIGALDELKPDSPGLGVCVIAEFGRLLLYNCLVDGSGEDENMDDEDSDNGEAPNTEEFRGYKQMLLVLRSKSVETGKSFLSELLLRIYHRKKRTLHSTLSFDSAKVLMGKGEPIVIDDWNNDDIGSTLLSRASKSIWGKAQITIRNEAITPKSNLLLCTNEEVQDLKVEGRNKEEIYQKLSVLDLGEKPMSSSSCENKEALFKLIFDMTKVIRNNLPSFYGLILQMSGSYITADEFKEYHHITDHERLGNLLKNVKNLYEKLKQFCAEDRIEPPKSLLYELNTSCLTNKSELCHKFLKPDQVVEYIMDSGVKTALTTHDSKDGIAFLYKGLSSLPWYGPSLDDKKGGSRVFTKTRTRQLTQNKAPVMAAFLSFEFLSPSVIEKVKEYAGKHDETETEEMETDEVVIDPKKVLANHFESDCAEYEKRRSERFDSAEKFVLGLMKQNSESVPQVSKFVCQYCNFIAKNKGGLTNHLKRCNKNPKS